jgi:hypothetical protein
MGTTMSAARSEPLPESIDENYQQHVDVLSSPKTPHTPSQTRSSETGGNVYGSRLVELMQSLQRLSRLHEQAVTAQVHDRQKRREVGFKRTDVWVCDAKFMKELQKLSAQGKLKDFEELQKLGNACQNARDVLGPLEEQSIEADQRWESQTFRLMQAEDSVYKDFKAEFEEADKYSLETSYKSSNRSLFSSIHGSQLPDNVPNGGDDDYYYQSMPSAAYSSSLPPITPSMRPTFRESDPGTPPDSMLLGLNDTEHGPAFVPLPPSRGHEHAWNSDSSIPADFDFTQGDLGSGQNGTASGLDLDKHDSDRLYSGVESYPLLTDFVSRRDRINKWLLQTALLSHVEATILKGQLEVENSEAPSNWSQLVIAFWERDEAAVSNKHMVAPLDPNLHDNNFSTPVTLDLSGSRSPSQHSNHATFGLPSTVASQAYNRNTSALPSPKRKESIIPRRSPPPPPLKQLRNYDNTISDHRDDRPKNRQPP